MRFEQLIRMSPKIFVVAAGLDFVKQTLWVLPYWFQEQESARIGAMLDNRVKLELADRILGLILYPLAWMASAIIVTLLLAIYDHRKAAE